MDFFSLASGNMLQPGNLLSWNVWFKAPKLVDQEEWRTHAERWRKSIDEGHDAHAGGPARYFDGTAFNPVEQLIAEKVWEILVWIYKHLKDLKGRVSTKVIRTAARLLAKLVEAEIPD